MGGDPIWVEPSDHEEILSNTTIWKVFVEGGLDHFMLACNGYDRDLYEAIIDSWLDRNYSFNNIEFNISLEMITEAIHILNEVIHFWREAKE